MQVIPLSLQVSPGLISVRILACQREWSPTELDARRFSLKSGSRETPALPLRKALAPFVPVMFRLEFALSTVSEPLSLVLGKGIWGKAEIFDLLQQPLYEQEQIDRLEDECHSAWFEHALELELTYRFPARFRGGNTNLDRAIALLDRYLHAVPGDEEARRALERIRLKKELARAISAGDWLRVNGLNERLRARQPDWQGPDAERESPLDMAYQALQNGLLEVAEERLQKALEVGDRRSAAALLLARLCAAWGRQPIESAHWYVQYFVSGGTDDSVAYEAIRLLDGLGNEAMGYRARLLGELAERLVLHSEDRELAELVYQLAESQAEQGADVSDDFSLLWACYEKAFEQQMVVDKHIDRMLLVRLEKLYHRLGNHIGWIRIRRLLADLEPSQTGHREELARLLLSCEEYEAAFCARMALWLSDPLDSDKTECLADAAEYAGHTGVMQRTRTLSAFYQGRPLSPEAGPDVDSVPPRLLLHPELRPLAPVLLGWVRAGEKKQDEPAGSAPAPESKKTSPLSAEETARDPVDERGELVRGLRMLCAPLGDGQWKELEAFVRQVPMTPAMEGALVVRPSEEHQTGHLHPLRVAAQVSLDRIGVLEAGGWLQGLDALDPPLGQGADTLPEALGKIEDPEERRLAWHRLAELAKFYLGRAWEQDVAALTSYPISPIGDLLEAVYLRGFPGWSMRTYLVDVQKKAKLSRGQWEQTEARVLRFLYLEPGGMEQAVEV